MKKAVILLSGGLDSATVLALAQSKNYECYALTFDYSQRHRVEIEKAQSIATNFNVKKHHILRLDLSMLTSSALVSDLQVPKHTSVDDIEMGIPITYVPARNTIFLSLALAWAEVLEALDIFIGVNAVDYSGYPDCRQEYIRAFETMAHRATRIGVEGQRITIHAPLIHLTKGQIIQMGSELHVDYSITHSCYDPGSTGDPCRKCDSCLLRKKGFDEAGFSDPAFIPQPSDSQ